MYAKYIKRILDIIFSLLLLIVAFPVFLIVAIIVRIKLGKPIIFRQKRPGLDEKVFTLYKFRTMTDERDSDGNLLPDNIRLTKFGRWLRNSSLDEIPELINILKGEMSFVGPRPLLVKYLPLYNEHQRKRHMVRPGLTGLAQVNGRNLLSWEEKFEYDIEYVENISFINDLKIILKTVVNVINKTGVDSKNTTGETMEAFKGNLTKDVVDTEISRKNVLFIASVTGHIISFHIPYLKMFKEAGYEVHVASNGEEEIEYADKHFNVNFSREPINKDNIGAYKELKKIIDEGNYDVIQCNTPAASVITRLAARDARKRGTRVIYMAHGFHFFKGAPLKNWILYYTIEKILSKYTDDLITINDEDYAVAKNKFKAKNIHYIHGIGINKSKFDITISDEEKAQLKASLNLNEDDFVILYVAELIHRKNQKMLIEAMKGLDNNYKVLLAGRGACKEEYEKLINENNLENKVYLLGYRKDIPKLLKIADIYVATSKMEGLPVNILEAKGSRLPIIVTNSRGQRELVKDGENGFIVEVGDVESLKEKIKILYEDKEIRDKFIKNSQNNLEKYCLDNVYAELKEIYIK